MRFVALLLLSSAAVAAPPPNVLFVLIDDLGFNDLGFHNRSADGGVAGRRIKTPILDGLADTGLVLNQYYVQEMCTPVGNICVHTEAPASLTRFFAKKTRGALMTGRYPFRYGMTAYTIGATEPWGIPIDETFLPEMLKPLGYNTAMAGKVRLSMKIF